MSSESYPQRYFGQATAMEVLPGRPSQKCYSFRNFLAANAVPSLSGSDCYIRSTGTSPYCQLRPNYNVVICSSCGSFPLRQNSDSSFFSLYSVRLLGMRQHVLQPFIFHLDIGIVKESLHCQSWRREKKPKPAGE